MLEFFSLLILPFDDPIQSCGSNTNLSLYSEPLFLEPTSQLILRLISHCLLDTSIRITNRPSNLTWSKHSPSFLHPLPPWTSPVFSTVVNDSITHLVTQTKNRSGPNFLPSLIPMSWCFSLSSPKYSQYPFPLLWLITCPVKSAACFNLTIAKTFLIMLSASSLAPPPIIDFPCSYQIIFEK